MELPKRKPTHLQRYDYSQNGAYFITICTHNKKCILETVKNQTMVLSNIGCIVEQEIMAVESRYSNIKIHNYTVMPNHVHLLIEITSSTERINPFPTMKRYDVSNVIGKFKAGVTRIVGNAFMHSAPPKIWQCSFHDHIIRNEQDYQKIWEYIEYNPCKWEGDCFYPHQKSQG